MSAFYLPSASQAQIIRANQRDVFHISSLREQLEASLRTWFGTRWILRWEKEIELFAKLAYFGLVNRYSYQTLGEEYTDIWQRSLRSPGLSSGKLRSAVVLFSILPSYFLRSLGSRLNARVPGTWFTKLVHHLPTLLDALSEINLAVFYFCGNYHDLTQRIFRIRHISTIPTNPNVTPPSYSILGLMITIRLAYRVIEFLRSYSSPDTPEAEREKGERRLHHISPGEPTIDTRNVSSILASMSADEHEPTSAEDDEHTMLYVPALSVEERMARRCTLCLEERTSTCATECGHLFCWSCISGWAKEKPECPLCRQLLNPIRLLPLYNL
ncbi:hypothetical protein K439DRAFT_1643984 [Ramaria rubella]|nr:hypothetical protein K439DRAFT_1643984 [Ramaria rubella]